MHIPSLSEKKVSAWIALMRAHKELLHAVESALKKADHPPLAWYDVLWELDKASEEGLRPKALEQRLLLPQYGLSRLLDRMEKAELLERRKIPGDRRAQSIHITQSGKRLRANMWPIYASVLNEVFARRLTVREATQLRDLLKKVRTASDD